MKEKSRYKLSTRERNFQVIKLNTQSKKDIGIPVHVCKRDIANCETIENFRVCSLRSQYGDLLWPHVHTRMIRIEIKFGKSYIHSIELWRRITLHSR